MRQEHNFRLSGQGQILKFRGFNIEQQVHVIKDRTLGSDSSIEFCILGFKDRALDIGGQGQKLD